MKESQSTVAYLTLLLTVRGSGSGIYGVGCLGWSMLQVGVPLYRSVARSGVSPRNTNRLLISTTALKHLEK
jgi:hypothetical protein